VYLVPVSVLSVVLTEFYYDIFVLFYYTLSTFQYLYAIELRAVIKSLSKFIELAPSSSGLGVSGSRHSGSNI
jgi:hypothetical protein